MGPLRVRLEKLVPNESAEIYKVTIKGQAGSGSCKI